jgi:hypothetical protein
MRTKASISAAEVHSYAASLVRRYLKVKDFGQRWSSSVIITILFYAASRLTSISDACARLREAPSDETFRQALLATLPSWAELQRRLNRALSADLPKSLQKQSQRIAIDIHQIPYHGQPLKEANEIRRGQSRRGTNRFHDYATAYVVRKGHRFTLAMTWIRKEDSYTDVLQRLLRQVRKLGIKVRVLLLDRGFYSAPVVRYLQASRTPFLMPLKAAGRRPRQERKVRTDTRRFFTHKHSGWHRHSWNSGGRRVSVQVCVYCRNDAGWKGKHGRHALVYAYWGFHPGSIAWIRQTYRKRFGIETSYRQMERARIRTTSRDPVRRLLFAGIALLLRNAWVWLHLMRLATRHGDVVTLHPEKLRFTNLLLNLQRFAEQLLNHEPPHTSQLPSPLPLATIPT